MTGYLAHDEFLHKNLARYHAPDDDGGLRHEQVSKIRKRETDAISLSNA